MFSNVEKYFSTLAAVESSNTMIRGEWPKAYIIAMSGGAGIGNWDGLAAARKLGTDQAIEKPFEADDLLALLREATASS